jgi:hypothetical protein
MHKPGMISIWFFIGVLLVAYGLLTTGAAIYEYYVPPAETTVLANLHAGIWWGAVILALGLFYSLRFYPRSGK